MPSGSRLYGRAARPQSPAPAGAAHPVQPDRDSHQRAAAALRHPPRRTTAKFRVCATPHPGTHDYAAFTDDELIPHTDGSSVPDPPGLVLLACQRPADEGGMTLVADGQRIVGKLAERYPAALRSLAAPRAAFFGTADGHLGPVCELAEPGRTSIRLRL